MTRKHLQKLLAAGVFSVGLLNGVAYAEKSPEKGDPTVTVEKDAPPDQDKTPAKDPKESKPDAKKETTSSKTPASHGCAGAGGCGSK